MKLTSRGRYAMQALLDLANNSKGKAVKLQDIALRQDISLFYLEQLFRQLRQGGVVKSVRGPGGGYVLARDASDVKVAQILLAVKELLDYTTKIKIASDSTPEAKIVVIYLTNVSNAIKKELERSLSELLELR